MCDKYIQTRKIGPYGPFFLAPVWDLPPEKRGIGQDGSTRTGRPQEPGIGKRYSSCLGTVGAVSVNQFLETVSLASSLSAAERNLSVTINSPGFA